MAREQGTIKWFNNKKGYGFITRPDKPDLFVHKTALGGERVNEGDVVEFEEGPGPKGNAAQNVTIITRGLAPSPTPATSAKSAPQTPPAKTAELSVDIIPLDEEQKGQHILLPVWVKIQKGKECVPGVEVRLTANGNEVKTPIANPSTDGSGKAIFSVKLSKDIKSCMLVANIDGKFYSQMWRQVGVIEPQQPKPSQPSKRWTTARKEVS